MCKFEIRQSVIVVKLFFIFILFPSKILSLTCFDGSRCDFKACGSCEGVACLRIIRTLPSSSDYYISPSRSSSAVISDVEGEVAMTCLPTDTRTYDLEPAGCRTNPISNLRTCVCYERDYCNSAPRFFSFSFPALIILVSAGSILQKVLLFLR